MLDAWFKNSLYSLKSSKLGSASKWFSTISLDSLLICLTTSFKSSAFSSTVSPNNSKPSCSTPSTASSNASSEVDSTTLVIACLSFSVTLLSLTIVCPSFLLTLLPGAVPTGL